MLWVVSREEVAICVRVCSRHKFLQETRRLERWSRRLRRTCGENGEEGVLLVGGMRLGVVNEGQEGGGSVGGGIWLCELVEESVDLLLLLGWEQLSEGVHACLH